MNLLRLNLPATIQGERPDPARPVLELNGAPLNHVHALTIEVDAGDEKKQRTLVTIRFYAKVEGEAFVEGLTTNA